MADKIAKALNKLSDRERKAAKLIFEDIARGAVNRYDLKKLKGHGNIFRIRKGKLRIIYRIDEFGGVFILTVERRSEHTYNF